MRNTFIAGAAAAGLLAWTAMGIAAEPGDRQADTAELTRLACEAGRAYARRDLAALDRLSADDYSQIDVRGGLLDRSSWLEFVKNRKSELSIECDDVRVRYFGDAAIVTGRWVYTHPTERESKPPVTTRWTSVWSRTADGWKRHAFQNTYVNAAADENAFQAARERR